jgi:2,3-bisphosphoglycerate-independent phosphoglycerate mutase
MNNKKPHVLMILDGWGISPELKGNSVLLADTPCLDGLKEKYPHTRLLSSGEAVGLPQGIMGNSEVGHLNIGAGRIVYQDISRINLAIQDRSFFQNSALNSAISKVKKNHRALHLIGLISDGGVHSSLEHLHALLEMINKSGLNDVFVHAILDGRDTPPDSGKNYINNLNNFLRSKKYGVIATICGRFYAMDRDKRWDRVERAYRLYVKGEGTFETDPAQAVINAYRRQETDEFVRPIVMVDETNKPLGIVRDEDGIIFFNFRADRARQITQVFTDPSFDAFTRKPFPKLGDFVCMTIYDEKFVLPVAFPPIHLDNILGEVISKKGLRQLRIAETEKYAHVTYFLNGGEETPFPLEDRCLIPSPREVATYDLKPEMSAYEVTKAAISRIKSNAYDLIVINFANPDMVGHTGMLEAAIKACESVDRCVEKIVIQVKVQGGVVLVTADHGNAEQMVDKSGQPHTAHTTNPVPFILVDDSRRNINLREGKLGDIAPTVLHIMGITQPVQMTGVSLIES